MGQQASVVGACNHGPGGLCSNCIETQLGQQTPMPDPEESLTKLESLITLFGHETDWGHPDIRGLLIMSLVG